MRFARLKGQRSGLPGPSRCCWPMTSSSVFGRSASASGTSSGLGERSLTDDVDTGGRCETELRGASDGCAAAVGEGQRGRLAEVVEQFHRFQILAGKTELQLLEAAVRRLGIASTHSSPALAGFRRAKFFSKLLPPPPTSKRRRRAAERGVHLLHGHLAQVGSYIQTFSPSPTSSWL